MARQIIDRGTTGNDGTGDDLYTAQVKSTITLKSYTVTLHRSNNLRCDSAAEIGIKLHDSTNNSSYLVYEGTADSHETSLE